MASQETLQQLVQRRQRELGGSTGPISTRQVWLRGGGEDEWSYETVRRIVERGHDKIGDKIADRLSIALNVPVSQIIAAAGQRPRGEPFVLPPRSARLSSTERNIMRAVMDAMLGAYAEDAGGDADADPPKLPGARRGARHLDLARPPEPDLSRVAARRGRSSGKARRDDQNRDPDDPS